MKFQHYLIEDIWRYFKKDSTGMPMYDEMIDNPDYYRERKHKDGKIIMMSPDEYLKQSGIIHGGHSMQSQYDQADPERVKDIINKIKSTGSKMPIPVIDYESKNQEGRHRAVISKKLGLKEIPVLVVHRI